MSPTRTPGARGRRLLLVGLSLLLLAPTPGDIGSCGQAPDALDPPIFFASKAAIDCRRCGECALTSAACESACDEDEPLPDEFPEGCFPVVHDGEVCLRALLHASCSDYRGYVRDDSPRAPSECNFCPPRSR